ncbi:MAG TPA: tyrosine--tRNA ligase [Longimicrobiales bacterium]
MDEILRDAADVISEAELAAKLDRSRRSGKPLVVKQGFDPTRPDLHIGHAISLRKLRVFQELGHEVVFVVGDYTARIGDPSGRSEARPGLSPEQIEASARTYVEQVGRVLDASRVRVERNSRWLAPLDLAAVLELTGRYTVARMLERDDFAERLAEGRPISIAEFLYPLLQAYDSVALEADVELGGTDQRFNLLVGRTIQERYGQEPQVCLILPLLRGTDGELKMSKSYDNAIGITEPPEEQYGKTMSIPDPLLEEWIRLATPLRGAALEDALRLAESDPYEAKRALARCIVRTYHGESAVEAAEAHFDRLFRERGVPEAIPVADVSLADPALRYTPEDGVWLPGLLVACGLASSTNEALRLIDQGAIAVDGERASDRAARVPARAGDILLLRRGRRRFVRARLRGGAAAAA